MNRRFWRDRRVAVTGHTGFKGAWLCEWLVFAGAKVSGLALAPHTQPNLFEVLGLQASMQSVRDDIRRPEALAAWLRDCQPEILFHLAAQSIVREGFANPALTFETNVQGTVNVLEAARNARSVRVVVVATSDKCYENVPDHPPFREPDRLGGRDPYSASKACAEIAVAAYRSSFFNDGNSTASIATTRAGNVIGGGDWAPDRIVPDAMRSFASGETLTVRNPDAVRPWQHVLDPLHGYLLLAEHLWEHGTAFAEGWNFGPPAADDRPVSWVASALARRWGKEAAWQAVAENPSREARALRLDSAKAQKRLGWEPVLGLEEALDWTIDWYRGLYSHREMRSATQAQLRRYCELIQAA